jgi:uncharacterized protein (DUF427 family)
MARAIWNKEIIAESDNCIETEGNLYFPPESVKMMWLLPSATLYHCPRKGEAGYYNLAVNGEVLKDAAWYYYETTEAAMALKNYVAFDKTIGVLVEGTASSKIVPPARVKSR